MTTQVPVASVVQISFPLPLIEQLTDPAVVTAYEIDPCPEASTDQVTGLAFVGYEFVADHATVWSALAMVAVDVSKVIV